MAVQKSLYQSTLDTLTDFSKLSYSEIGSNYPQRLDEDSTGNLSRLVYLNLREYIRHNGISFIDALERVPGLKRTLEEMLWLQAAVLNPPNSLDALDEVNHDLDSTIPGPTMSLCKLLAEAEECAWIIMDGLEDYELNRSNVQRVPRYDCQ